MKSFLKYLKANYIELLVGCGAIALLAIISLFLTNKNAIGAGVPSNGGLPGIYNATGTDLVLRNGYGSSLAVDQNGRLIMSPSSSFTHLSAKYVSSIDIDATGYVSTTQAKLSKGSLSKPAIVFANGPSNSGIYMTSGGSIAVGINGAVGIAATPNTGITFATSSIPNYNNLSFGSNAWPWLHLYGKNVSSTNVDALGYVSSTKLFAGKGSTTVPSIAFQGDLDTGFDQNNPNNVGIIGGGAIKMSLGSNGNISYDNFSPSANNSKNLGTYGSAWGNIYSSSTYFGNNMSLSGNATTSLATGRIELGRQGDVGSPFTYSHSFVSAGVAGTRNEEIMDVGDQYFYGRYYENSGTAQHPQNSKFNFYVPLVLNSGWAPKYQETNALTYALTSSDYRLYASTTGAAVAVSLPAATSVSAGTTFEVWDRSNNAATKNITITAKGANFILGTLSSVVIKKNCGYMRLVTDGLTNWQAASSTCYGTN